MRAFHQARASSWPAILFLWSVACPAHGQGQEGFSIRFSPPQAIVGERVLFHAAPLGIDPNGYQVSWKFGDGSDATPFIDFGVQDSMGHVFAMPGRFAILLRFRKDGITWTTNRLLSVNAKPTLAKPVTSSTLILTKDGASVWCVNPDQNSVTRIDAWTLQAALKAMVGRNPVSLAEAPDRVIWVADKGSASVTLLDPSTGAILKTLGLPYACQPHGLVFSQDGKYAYIALEATGRVAVADVASRTLLTFIDLGPTPRALALSHDGSRLLSPRFLSLRTGAEVRMAQVGGAPAPSLVGSLLIPPQTGGDTEGNGRGVPNCLGTVAITPDGRKAFFAAKKDNLARGLQRDGLRLTFENTVRTTVFSLDMADLTSRMEERFDIDNSNLPTALVFSPRGDQLFVALEGNRQVRVLDPYNGGSELARVSGTGSAPGGLLMDGERGRLYIHSLLDRQVEVYDIGSILDNSDYSYRKLAAVRTIGSETLPAPVLLGKRLFHSADSLLSRDGYLSCAACHPDGKSDGMVWDFTDRGEGLRKTIPLIGRSGTGHGPVHWSANFDEIQDFEHDIRGPFAGVGLMEADAFAGGTRSSPLGDPKGGFSASLDALADYVVSLKAVDPSPFRDPSGKMTAAALRGKSLFFDAETACSSCHAGAEFTDSRIPSPGDPKGPAQAMVYAKATSIRTAEGFLLHDVGTLSPASGHRLHGELPGLDTPTLKGIWQFPPYLHDGSAFTLREVLVDRNPADRHGKTSHLRPEQLEDLIAYLLQLDEDPEGGPAKLAAGQVNRKGAGKAILSIAGLSGKAESVRPVLIAEGADVFEISGRKSTRQPKEEHHGNP